MAGWTVGLAMSLGREASGETAGSSGENRRFGESGGGKSVECGRVGESGVAELLEFGIEVVFEGEHDGFDHQSDITERSSVHVNR